MILLKLGGSMLTNKAKPFSLRRAVLRRVASEISAAKEPLIVVHGGGSFGHPLAKRYALQKGFKGARQLRGAALTREAMEKLNQLVVEALVKKGVNAVSLQTSAIAVCEDKRIKSFNLATLKKFLALGLVPVLYGDVVADEKLGFCILSGDQLILRLAQELKPEKIILAADVDGVFERDPKRFKRAKLIEEINENNYREVLEKIANTKTKKGGIGATGYDVTGSIKGKLIELLRLANLGYEAAIVNALEAHRLKKALLGLEVKGTKIRKGNYHIFEKRVKNIGVE